MEIEDPVHRLCDILHDCENEENILCDSDIPLYKEEEEPFEELSETLRAITFVRVCNICVVDHVVSATSVIARKFALRKLNIIKNIYINQNVIIVKQLVHCQQKLRKEIINVLINVLYYVKYSTT